MRRVRVRTVAGVVARAAGAASALDIVVLVRTWGCTPDGVDVETSDASRPGAGAFGRVRERLPGFLFEALFGCLAPKQAVEVSDSRFIFR